MNWKYLDGKLYINDNLLEPTSAKSLDAMREVLHESSATGPDPIYYVYQNIEWENIPPGQVAEITVLQPGKIGSEYTKTFGHYHIGDGVETYTLLSGQGLLIIQTPDFDYNGIETVRIIHLSEGQSVDIPPRSGHSLVNTGSEPLIVLDHRDPATTDHLYAPYSKNRGASYYILEMNGQPEIVANEHYGDVPKPQNY